MANDFRMTGSDWAAAALSVGFGAAFAWAGWLLLGVVLGNALFLFLAMGNVARRLRRKRRAMAQARGGESYASFLAALPDDLRQADTAAKDELRIIHDAVRLHSGLDRDGIALRPGDRLYADLDFDPDDLDDDLWSALAAPLNLDRSPGASADNPHAFKVETVLDLLRYFLAHRRAEPGPVGGSHTDPPQ